VPLAGGMNYNLQKNRIKLCSYSSFLYLCIIKQKNIIQKYFYQLKTRNYEKEFIYSFGLFDDNVSPRYGR
jgi:hypothetical protein